MRNALRSESSRLPYVIVLLLVLLAAGSIQLGSQGDLGDATDQACCFADGRCQDLHPDTCRDMGGEPQGDGTTCSDVSCDQPTQACCYPDGRCRDQDVESCSSSGGEPQGEDTDCRHTSCAQPTRACCFADGSCQDLTVQECRAQGGTPRGLSSTCFRTHCPQPETTTPIASIRLLSPLPGLGLEDTTQGTQFCWEALGTPGITYEVVHHSKQCDPDVVNGPHPFSPLFPDPQLANRRRAQQARKQELELKLGYLTDYCGDLSRMFDQVEQRLSEMADELAGLERGRDEADAAQVDSEEEPFELPLPSACPRSAEEILAPYAELVDGADVDPCDVDACWALAGHLRDLVGIIQSLDAHAVVQRLEFERLLRRWLNGADHRGTMELYHGLFSLVDKAISLVTDLIDLLTPDVEELIQGLIEDALGSAACAHSPELCAAIETAGDVRDQLETVLAILESARSSGTPGPAFLVQMVQAMAQQASAATATGVEGWANFAEVMGAILWDAYESLLCDQQVLAWLNDRRERIEAMCEACQACLRQDIANVDSELEAIAAEERAATAARTEYWQEQLAAIAAAVTQAGAYLDDAWYDACCTQGTRTITIPSEDSCAQALEEALKQALGDKACFLNFSCTLQCNFENGQVVGASIECEHSFPLSERRPCCCVPCERTRTPLGTAPDPGQPGATVCHPPAGASPTPEPGAWGVEARDEAGRLVASSPRRELGRGIQTDPSYLTPGPTPATACTCAVSGKVAGIAGASSGPPVPVVQGIPAVISVDGDCGPDCSAGATTISIQPPVVAPAWLAWALALPAPPLSIAASSTTYDFPAAGSYSITVSRFCEDGKECSSTFTVDASAPRGPVTRQPRPGEDGLGTCPTCGADPCLELAYTRDGIPPATPLSGHRLAVAAPMELALELTSACRPDCSGDRDVRWEITTPDGALQVFEDISLYALTYDFDSPGQYLLCVIETVPCGDGLLRFENWWRFDAAANSGGP